MHTKTPLIVAKNKADVSGGGGVCAADLLHLCFVVGALARKYWAFFQFFCHALCNHVVCFGSFLKQLPAELDPM